MKLKLAQRLLILYYKNKLRTIAISSPRKAAEAAFDIFCTPFDNKLPKKAPPVFHKAENLFITVAGITLRGYRWLPERFNGKKILIIHGFRSCAYKFEKYILSLKNNGFEVVAFDAPAHGASDGKRINAYVYKQAIIEIELQYGPFYGLMGHSLGGLVAALAFEEFTDHDKRKLVLISPAETETAIRNFFMILPVTEKVKDEFYKLIEDLTGKPVNYYSTSRVVKTLSSPVLWIHDKQDAICLFEDVEPLFSLDLPAVDFFITEELGHNKIYHDSKVHHEIVQFFTAGISANVSV